MPSDIYENAHTQTHMYRVVINVYPTYTKRETQMTIFAQVSKSADAGMN